MAAMVGSAMPDAASLPPPDAPHATLWTVQVMRGAAALMVVIGHGQTAVAGVMQASGRDFARSLIVPWGAGVDLFFVISGFIIVHASRGLFAKPGGRRTFLRRRIARVVPLYWLVTTVFLLLLLAARLKGGDALPGLAAVAASFFFVPADSWGDGRLFPVFDLGWTLNYEMFFYALFALIVGLPRARALTLLALLIAALVMLGEALPAGSAAWFWTRPIIVDFALGVGVGALFAGHRPLPGIVRVGLAVGALAVLLADPGHVFDVGPGVTVANAWPRVLLAGLPVTVLLAAAVLGPQPRTPWGAAALTRIGDASYSLYLLHPFALIAMEKLAQKSELSRLVPGWLLVAGVVIASIALALAGYRWIERPISTAISRPRSPTGRIAIA